MSSQRRRRRGRGRRRTAEPYLYVSENVAFATADTPVNTTLYINPSGENARIFNIRSMELTMLPGATTNQSLFIIRKVPQGYAAPGITVATGTSYVDHPNILGYVLVTSVGGITFSNLVNEKDFTWRRQSVLLHGGDFISLQAVTNTSSAGQTYQATGMFDILLP